MCQWESCTETTARSNTYNVWINSWGNAQVDQCPLQHNILDLRMLNNCLSTVQAKRKLNPSILFIHQELVAASIYSRNTGTGEGVLFQLGYFSILKCIWIIGQTQTNKSVTLESQLNLQDYKKIKQQNSVRCHQKLNC